MLGCIVAGMERRMAPLSRMSRPKTVAPSGLRVAGSTNYAFAKKLRHRKGAHYADAVLRVGGRLRNLARICRRPLPDRGRPARPVGYLGRRAWPARRHLQEAWDHARHS